MSEQERNEPAEKQEYEPPQAEDVDTTHDLSETASGGPGVGSPTPGAAESDRWH